jgi:hypothetical protein
VDNQHRKISGYRELSQDEIDLMNKIKAFGPQLQSLIVDVRNHVKKQRADASVVTNPEDDSKAFETLCRLDDAQPERWAAIGGTHFQEGLMALTRAVAQPTFF